MIEQVIITPVGITKAGQIKYFQIRLPKNSKQIIGIEIGVRRITGIPESQLNEQNILVELRNTGWLTYKRNTFIGELKLQSCEEANIFYSTDIQMDQNLGFGDFSQHPKWQANVFSHQSKTEEDTVVVNGDTTIVQGIYKDHIGEQNKTDLQYIVNVYVWVEMGIEIQPERIFRK